MKLSKFCRVSFDCFAVLVAGLAIVVGPRSATAQRALGIDVSGFQGGSINWTNVKDAGISFAWTKAAEATPSDGYIDPSEDFAVNENNGKTAGVYMGAYYFAHPGLDSPVTAANYFWSVAGSYILADGKTIMPMLDMEVFTGLVGATSYSDWVNQWCNYVIADAAAVGVAVRPVLYVSACNAGNFDSSVSRWISNIADYNGENAQGGTPWSVCSGDDVWGPGVWSVWQYSTNGSISGIPGNVDEDVFNGPLSSMIASLAAVPSSPSSPSMVLIPAGSFQMGDNLNEGYPDELPVHSVYVSAFYMDQSLVTEASWDNVYQWATANGYTFDNPGSGRAANHPVQTINWWDSVKWCNARSEQAGLTPCYYTDATQTTIYRSGQIAMTNACVNWSANGYRLPTEDEWEKAARGGLSGQRFPWGDTIDETQANYYSCTNCIAQGCENCYLYDVNPTSENNPTWDYGAYPWTNPGGAFAPNAYGLYDMAGNVWEWCWDWYDPNWYNNPAATQSDSQSPTTSQCYRVFRGGAWDFLAFGARSAFRGANAGDPCGSPVSASSRLGFRCVTTSVMSGSTGNDGAFNPTTNTVINMVDHPDGIYQYTSVNIPTGVTVTFIPNPNNTPVTWLVQNGCVIDGTVDLQGQGAGGPPPYPNVPCLTNGGVGGPGGGAGGNGGYNPSPGQGPGGGVVPAGGGGFGTPGTHPWGSGAGGQSYGNPSLIPLVGGSGGAAGGEYLSGGGGGGGAILINASSFVELNGVIESMGTLGFYSGGGSGGAVRIATPNFSGTGSILTIFTQDGGGGGRVRIDSLQDTFSGQITGSYTQGSPISMGNVVIDVQPANQFVQTRSSATFNVLADGQQPLTYQWQFNGVTIVGQTSPSLTLKSVSAASSGAYSVIVSNPYDFVTSANADLSVLGDGANGNTPIQTTAAPLPSKPNGVTELILITHGWEPEGPVSAASDLSWMNQMQADIIAQVNNSHCFVTTYPWGGSTPLAGAWTLDPDTALYHAKIIGTELGYEIGNGFQSVHLIGHSAGAGLIQAAADAIRQVSPTTVIQETFLDPYTGPFLEGRSEYGLNANWADDYFVVDFLTDVGGVATTGYFDSTSGQLRYAYNVDVSGTLQAATQLPVFGIAGSTPMINTTPSHGTPIDFYISTINGSSPSCASGYGFPLSIEAGGSGSWGSYPVNNSPLPLCSALTISQNQQPVVTSSSLNFLQLPTGTSSGAVNLFGSGASLSADDPSWLAVGVTITNSVNFVQFDCGFTDTNQTDGLLTVYWNTNQVGEVDERVALPQGLQTYRFALPATVSSGLYTLGFRLDAFSEATSVAITNVTTGFIGVSQPISLQIQPPVSGSPLALQLTAPSGYDYLVQSSTNLLDWTPSAVLVNTNGTVTFTDSTWTNANARFYRALIP